MTYGTINADIIGTSVAGSNLGAGNASIMKNRIINGAMVIDQRNAGASISNSGASGQFSVDRWQIFGDVASKFTAQQSSTAPAGFINSLLATSSTAYSVPSGESYNIQQRIEGLNVTDLGWGTADAKTVTLSFWVRSSLTGTFGGSLTNSAFNRSYPYSYTISSANTWEQKTVTIAGDTTGTWLTTNGIGIRVYFSLGTGTTLSGTAGSWAGSGYTSATGATSVVGTNGATFYITGVQLEVGSSATGFEYRPYTTELQLCQRYLPAWNGAGGIGWGYNNGSTLEAMVPFLVTARTIPTGITVSSMAHFLVYWASTSTAPSTISFQTGGTQSTLLNVGTAATAYQGGLLIASNSSAQILFTGCEL